MKNKFSFASIFYNDRFVLVFSVFLAIVLWFIMAIVNTEERAREISDVPVTVTLSESAQADGLRVFSQSVDKAKVYIKGDSFTVHNIQPENLKIVAEGASSITQPTSAQLSLKVERQAQLAEDYSVTIEPSTVFVDVDYYKEVTFDISKDNIKYKADSSYLASEPALSTDTVVISGPEKEISKIARVAIDYELPGTLISTQTFTADLVLYDRYGEKLPTDRFTMSTEQVDVTINVRSRQTLMLQPTFLNQPSGLVLNSERVTVDPETIQIAGPEDVLANSTTISLEPIDFSKVSPANNTFTVAVTLPPGCSNISMIHEAQVTLNLSDFTTKNFTVTNFEVKNLAAGKKSDVFTKSLNVVLVGPKEEIDALTEDDIVGQIDMTGKDDLTGAIEMSVGFSIANGPSCWVYGSYQVNVGIEETGA